MGEQPWWRPATAEFIGTFALVFIGAGSIVTLGRLNIANPGQEVTVLLGVALAHGLTIAVMVFALGHISGGHFNPAVTIAAMSTKRIAPPLGVTYMVAQILGGSAGAFVLVAGLPADWWQGFFLGTPTLYGTVNGLQGSLDPMKGIVVEAILTFFLVLVIFGAAMDQRNTSRVVGGLAIGLTISADILMGGFLTGAAMNPARAFATALVAKQWTLHYVYWVGPIVGGLLAALVYDVAFVETRVKPSSIPPAEAPMPAPAPEPAAPMEPQGGEPPVM